jgi:hypothetical protein
VKTKFSVTDAQQVVSIGKIRIYPNSLLAGLPGFSVKTKFPVTDALIVVSLCISGIKPDGLLVSLYGFSCEDLVHRS